MELSAFLSLCEGKWFSQRTHYAFGPQQADSHKSELTIELLPTLAEELVPVWPSWGDALNSSALIIQTSWDNAVDWGKPKQCGSVVLAFWPEQKYPQRGQMWRSPWGHQKEGVRGTYQLGEDESLSYTWEQGEWRGQERLWFASPNLRMRTCLIQRGVDFSHSAFYSEIRKLPPKEATEVPE
jgi:hypothetical protein